MGDNAPEGLRERGAEIHEGVEGDIEALGVPFPMLEQLFPELSQEIAELRRQLEAAQERADAEAQRAQLDERGIDLDPELGSIQDGEHPIHIGQTDILDGE